MQTIEPKLETHNVSDILEVACGQGHMMCLLESRGYRVTGLDLSPEMLRYARTRVKGGLIQQDMRSIGGRQVFDAVLCFGNSFTYMQTDEDVNRALDCFNKALRDGGVLIFDNFNAAGFDLTRHGVWQEAVYTFQDMTIRRFTRSRGWSDADQTWTVDWRYVIETKEGVREILDRAMLKAFHEKYLRDRLEEHGFRVSVLNKRRMMLHAEKIREPT